MSKKIIDLEGLTAGPLPLTPLIKVLKGKTLNPIDSKIFEKWIKKINKSLCSPLPLHHTIRAITALFETSKKKFDPVALEVFLEDKGCSVFQKEDPKHLLWRRHLKNGSILAFDNKFITFNTEIHRHLSEADQTRVFSLLGNPDLVAIIAQNKVVLPMKQLRHKPGKGFGIEPAPLLEVSQDGRIGIMERLKPLDSWKWTSLQGNISAGDAPLLKSLKDLLLWLVQQNLTPSNFAPSNIMFDKKYHLKSLKITSKQAFDFNALENFVLQCSSGNLFIFQHLMSETGLSNHTIAKFYHEMMGNALKGEESAADDLAGIYKIEDPKVVDRGKELAKEAVILQRRLYSQVREHHPESEPKKLTKMIADTLLAYHQRNKAAAVLWPTLEQEVLNKMLKPRVPNRSDI